MIGWAPSTWGDSRRSTAQIGEPSPQASSVWFKWTGPSTGPATIATTGSLYDTVVDVFTGTKVSNLSLVTTDDYSGVGATSVASFTAGSSVSYSLPPLAGRPQRRNHDRDYTTVGESATPNLDYTPASGTMTFVPGQLVAVVEVKSPSMRSPSPRRHSGSSSSTRWGCGSRTAQGRAPS